MLGPLPRLLGAIVRSPFGRGRLQPLAAVQSRETLHELTALLESGAIAPVVEAVYPLSETADGAPALRRTTCPIQDRHQPGGSIMIANTLTDRYVAATLRTLPEKQRPDIEKELRASIADAIDDRVEAGSTADAAEREVLIELGDPGRLAASYAGRPLYLIGPTLFLDYIRLLKLLLWIVVPIVFVAIFVIDVFQGGLDRRATSGRDRRRSPSASTSAFWTTLVFALVERTGPAPSPGRAGRRTC